MVLHVEREGVGPYRRPPHHSTTAGASATEEPEPAPGANGRVLLSRGGGYVLEVAPGEFDLECFRDLAERGRDALAAGRPGEAATVLREALGIWRGAPLAEFAYEPFAQGAIAQLEELHLAAVEDRVERPIWHSVAPGSWSESCATWSPATRCESDSSKPSPARWARGQRG